MSSGSTQGTSMTRMVANRSATLSGVRSASGMSGANNAYVGALWISFVLIDVGATQLTRIPNGANSSACDFNSPTTPCLAATYGDGFCIPLIAMVELVKISDPPVPWRSRIGIAAPHILRRAHASGRRSHARRPER